MIMITMINMWRKLPFACRIHQIEEKIMVQSGETPVILFEMKQKVENFREKLEVGMCDKVKEFLQPAS